MHRLTLVPLAAVAAFALGCGEGEGGEAAGKAVTTTAAGVAVAEREPGVAGRPQGTRIKVVDSEFGRVIANGRGEALYLFDKERGGRAACYGTCATVWPPVLTKGKPIAGGGARAGLLGTTWRANGKLQVTYAGQPLYFYVGDSPGTILCHDVEEFGGNWLVVEPSGRAAS